MKPFIVFWGDSHSEVGWHGYVGSYDTFEQARQYVDGLVKPRCQSHIFCHIVDYPEEKIVAEFFYDHIDKKRHWSGEYVEEDNDE